MSSKYSRDSKKKNKKKELSSRSSKKETRRALEASEPPDGSTSDRIVVPLDAVLDANSRYIAWNIQVRRFWKRIKAPFVACYHENCVPSYRNYHEAAATAELADL